MIKIVAIHIQLAVVTELLYIQYTFCLLFVSRWLMASMMHKVLHGNVAGGSNAMQVQSTPHKERRKGRLVCMPEHDLDRMAALREGQHRRSS